MNKWLTIVGIGEGGLGDLTPRARARIEEAEILVGGDRHLAMIGEDDRPRLVWRNPFADVLAEIVALRGRRVCVLASGDPMMFGVGATLAARVPAAEIMILPTPSAFSLVCARLAWPLAETEIVTLHGRPLAGLYRHLYPGARILVLSENGETPAQVARALIEHGYGDSQLWVFEHLDGAAERCIEGRAADWNAPAGADLNTIAIACAGASAATPLSRLAGLPDDAFEHDGQLTKREVRAATLAALAPLPGQTLWDVGAGCGSVAIEWMRAAPRARAIAIERDGVRQRMIAANADRLGVPDLHIVAGEAPAILDGLARPDAIFIGGGATTPGLIDACWQALAPGGRLVANVVTVEGETALAGWQGRFGGDLSRISISRAAAIGPFTGWRPLRTVTQYSGIKP